MERYSVFPVLAHVSETPQTYKVITHQLTPNTSFYNDLRQLAGKYE